MSEIQLSRQNAPKKTKMTLYKWRFTNYGNKNYPTYKFWYYSKEDAKKAALDHVRCAEDLASKGCEIDCVMKVTVNPLNYMRDLYYTLILKTLSTVQQVICEGCNGQLSSDDVAQWGKNKCMASKRNVLKGFWELAMKVLSDSLVVEVFYNWKKLNLHFVDAMSLLTEIRTSLEDNVQLQAVVSTMIDTMHEHPVYMMMSGSFREMDIYQKVHFIVICNVHIDKGEKAKKICVEL